MHNAECLEQFKCQMRLALDVDGRLALDVDGN